MKVFATTSILALLFATPALAQEAAAPTTSTPQQQIEALQHQVLDLSQKLGRATYQAETVLPGMLAEAQHQRTEALTDAEANRQTSAATENFAKAQAARASAAEKKGADLEAKVKTITEEKTALETKLEDADKKIADVEKQRDDSIHESTGYSPLMTPKASPESKSTVRSAVPRE